MWAIAVTSATGSPSAPMARPEKQQSRMTTLVRARLSSTQLRTCEYGRAVMPSRFGRQSVIRLARYSSPLRLTRPWPT